MDSDSARRWFIDTLKDDREHRFKLYYAIYISCGVILIRSIQSDVPTTLLVKAVQGLCLLTVLFLFVAHRIAVDAIGTAQQLYAVEHGVEIGGKRADILKCEVKAQSTRCVLFEAAGLISATFLFVWVVVLLFLLGRALI